MNRPGPSAMTLPRIPPPIEMSNDTKRAIIDGIKEIIEILKAAGRVAEDYSYSKIIREPRDLYRFIKAFRNSSELVGAIVKDPVQDAIVLREYLETVARERTGWRDLYTAMREIAM